MEDDCEKSAEKISAVACEDTPVNENSNGLPPAPDEASLGVDESSNYVPNADFDESSQGFLAPSFGAGDNAVNFQDNSIHNEEESCDAAAIVSDGSRNGNDDSNPPCRASAVNTQQILQDIESSTMDDYVDETAMSEQLLNTDSNYVEHINSREPAENSLEPVENPVEMVEDSVDLPENLVEPADDTQNISDEMLVEDVRELISAETKKEAERNEYVEKKMESEAGREADTEVVSEDELPAVEKPRVQDAENVSDDELPGPRQADLPADTERVAGREADTEVVSEDELPAVEKPRVQDAENVSDEELPGPRPADLPADTEVVSEDELPSSKKEREDEKGARAAAAEGADGTGSRKRKPENGERDSSSAGDDDNAAKKQAVVKNGESKPVAAEKRPSTEEKEKKKKALPELDKYWKVVNDDPSDFTGWTYLLQYVDQESDVEAAREAYDAFLSHYPYCYGYWRKYADYEKRKGSKKKCFEVLERGLKAIPLSVDLWIHYLNHIKTTKGEDITYVRQQYDRAIDACGLEFRSDRLWESYIKWESEHGTPLNVTAIYDRLLATPTLSYTSHFDNFQEHIMSEGVASLVAREELVRVRAEVREGTVAPPAADLPPGEDEPEDHIASEEEGLAIKERVIALRRKVHKATGEQVAQRWTFEEGIKRPYFHVKPLERSQLKNWKAYLEWEKQHGTFKRALVLHERCLIACALYEEFWLRLVKFLEEASESDPSLVTLEREALERACTVHHLDKPALHLHWAYFEEAHGNVTRAADILERLEKACPNLLQVAYRRINLERRRGDLDKCVQLYESYIASAKSKPIGTALAIKYARFLQRARSDTPGALRVLAEAAAREPLAHRLYLQQLDIALHTPGTPYQQLSGYLEAYEKVEGAEVETSAAMAWRRLELAEELGTAAAARAAYNHQRTLARHLRKRARQSKREPSPPPDPSSQKKKDSSSSGGGGGSGGGAGSGGGGGSAGTASGAAPAPVGAGAYYPPSAPPPQPYDQPPYQQQYQPPWNHYQQHPPNPYHHNPWGQYPNYY